MLAVQQRARDLMRNTQAVTRKSTINGTTKFLLIVFGIWPEVSCVTFCRLFWSISFGIIAIGQYRYLIVHFYSSDVFVLMDCFSALLGFTKVFLKFNIFWWNQRWVTTFFDRVKTIYSSNELFYRAWRVSWLKQVKFIFPIYMLPSKPEIRQPDLARQN